MSASIVIDPRLKFGSPAIEHTRIDPDMIASTLLACSYEEVMLSWPHLSRDDVLVACWYVARYGRPKDWPAKQFRRLRTWLDDAQVPMWESEDWSEVPLP